MSEANALARLGIPEPSLLDDVICTDISYACAHARIQKVWTPFGKTFFFFLVDERRENPNTAICGRTSAFRWRADDGQTLNAGLVHVAL